MQKRLILDSHILDVTLERLCQHVIENHGNFENSVILGLQPRGIYLADIIKSKLESNLEHDIPLGYLDTTFYRDDFRRRDEPVAANATKVDFLIESKKVIIVDDVLFTGRSVRAAMDAMIAFGRPEKVELLVLVDRKYSRELPIEPDYVGKHVNTIESQKVLVEWEAQGKKENKVWLVTQGNN